MAAAVGGYGVLGASWALFAALLFVPDVFMAGYLAGPRIGAAVYNAGHTYVVPLGLGALAGVLAAPLLGAVALIWTVHIGMDRALGYGLKRPGGFYDTHLSDFIGQPGGDAVVPEAEPLPDRRSGSPTREAPAS